MANIASAAKRHKQSVKRRVHNRGVRGTVRTAIKRFDTAVAAGDAVQAQESFVLAQKLLDTAAGKGVYHANSVARKKSRMNKKLKAVQTA
ncbi:MAG: 30S ribosomal protein S20 [Spirochaeta sp.]